jgi:tetratricopeptide (TPR) repeat protein
LLNLGVANIGRDPRLALDRSRAAHDMASRFGFRGTYATALGNAAEVAIVLGEWDWALRATSDASIEHLEPGDRATILRAPEEILAMRGESTDAVLAEHEALLTDRGDSQQRSNLVAGRGVAAFVAGRYDEAAQLFRTSSDLNATNASTDMPRMTRAALWTQDVTVLREAVAELDRAELHGRQLDISRRTFRAALAALDGDTETAAEAYAAVLPELAELGLVLEQALVVIDMALVLGPDAPVVRASVDDARAILERLGARPFLARLDLLLETAPALPRAVHSQESVSSPG